MQTCNALVVVVVVVAVLVSRKHIAHSLCFALTLAGCKRRNGETDTMSVFVLPVFIYFEMHDIFFACGRNGFRNGLFVCNGGGGGGGSISIILCVKLKLSVDCYY